MTEHFVPKSPKVLPSTVLVNPAGRVELIFAERKTPIPHGTRPVFVLDAQFPSNHPRIMLEEESNPLGSTDSTSRPVNPHPLLTPKMSGSENFDMTMRIAHQLTSSEVTSSEVSTLNLANSSHPDSSRISKYNPFPREDTIAFEMGSMDLTIPQKAPLRMDYEVRSEIARGGMGKIYSADDPLLKRAVAVKMSNARDPAHDCKFSREAEVLAALEHPNIVPIYNLGFDAEGRPFYSMKLIQGRTLQRIIKELAAGDRETAIQ